MAERKIVVRLDDDDETEALIADYIASIPRHRRQERIRRILWLGMGVENKVVAGSRSGRPTKSKSTRSESGRKNQESVAKKILSDSEKSEGGEKVSNNSSLLDIVNAGDNLSELEEDNSNSLQMDDDIVKSDIHEDNDQNLESFDGNGFSDDELDDKIY